MLKQGDSGEKVEALQRRLTRAGFDPGPVDGAFGPKTDAAVRALQAANGLQVDGIYGPQSRQAMKALLGGGADQAEEEAPEAAPSLEDLAKKIAEKSDDGGSTPL